MSHPDKPALFNLDAVAAEADLTPFRFSFRGKPYQLPHLSDTDTFSTMTHFGAANVNEAVGMFRVLCSELGEKAVEQLKGAGMKMWQFNALLKAWQKHAGVEPGESAGSTAS